MRKLLVGLLITGSLCLACTPRIAIAGSGDVAAGIVGGFAVGTLFGAAASGPRYRLTYDLKPDGLVGIQFELAAPGKPYLTYLTSTVRKKRA